MFPVRWHEPFGIAIIEALAKGRPVIGSSYGSLPELIGPEKQGGLVCKNYSEFERVISDPPIHFLSEQVRDYFEKNFTSRIMANNYLPFYEQVIQGIPLHSKPPKTCFLDHPESLLEF